MVQINFAQKTVNAKIVYYGPGMSGKTTNLEVVHQRAPEKNRGELTSISTDGDRTLFFDFMPLDLGTVAGMRTAFQIYTVPGQVYYNSTRKLVLQGVDGVVFVADSSAAMLEQNLESLRNLEENLAEYGKNLAHLPHIIQFNKRDLPDAMPVAELDKHLNRHGVPTFEAVASSGQGVFPTLKALAASVLKHIMQESNLNRTKAAAPAANAVPAAAAPAAPPQAPPQAPPMQHVPPAPVHQHTPAAAQAPYQAPAPPTYQQAPPPAPGYGHPAGAPQHYDPYAQPPPQAAPQAVAWQEPPQPAAPASMMQPPRQGPAAAARAARAHSVPGTQAVQRRGSSELAVPRKRKSGVLTITFVLLAAGIGAGAAWAALTLL